MWRRSQALLAGAPSAPASPPRGRNAPLLNKERPADRFILMIDDLAVAHAVHVLGVAHWIGGVAAVTSVVLPQAQLLPTRMRRLQRVKNALGQSQFHRSKDKTIAVEGKARPDIRR